MTTDQQRPAPDVRPEAPAWATPLRVLVVTNMYPNPQAPFLGIFVKQQVESLTAKGVEVDVLFVNGPGNKLHYFWGVRRFRSQLARRRYHLIHAHYVYSGIIARLQLHTPVVVTFHSGEVLQGRLEPWLSRRLVGRVDAVVAVSGEVQAAIGEACRYVIPCGVDTDRFSPVPKEECRAALGLPQHEKLVLFAAAPRPEKRRDLAEAAVAIAQQRDSAVRFLPVSNEPPERMPLYMNAADVLLLTSDKEGSPQVVKEALACNLPVVSVPIGDVPDLTSGISGCRICNRDPADIAENLTSVLETGRCDGRPRIESHYSLPVIADSVLGVYRDVLYARGIMIGTGEQALWSRES